MTQTTTATSGGKRVLVIDVGGTNVKVGGTGRRTPVKIPSGRSMTAAQMAAAVLDATKDWEYDAVSIGYPGPVVDGRPDAEPANLGRGWVRFDYKKAFGKPVRIVNDAAMQALGAYRGSRMLFLGLGTGLGSALVVEGVLVPLELAHLPYRNGRSFEDYVGWRGEKRFGRKKWKKHVAIVIDLLRHAMQAEHVVIGGGAAKKLDRLPKGVRLGTNAHAMTGGERLWGDAGR
jgi:polyphosphate glucokinase